MARKKSKSEPAYRLNVLLTVGVWRFVTAALRGAVDDIMPRNDPRRRDALTCGGMLDTCGVDQLLNKLETKIDQINAAWQKRLRESQEETT